MPTRLVRSLAASLSLAAGACAGSGVGIDQPRPPGGGGGADTTVMPADTAVTLSMGVQPLFTASCAFSFCHAGAEPQAGMNLSSGLAYANTVNVASAQLPSMRRVRPGLPDSSYLVHKIQGTHLAVGGAGGRMPLIGAVLSQDEIDRIRRWISQGARDN